MSFARPTLTTIVARVQADLLARFPGANSQVRRATIKVVATVWGGIMHMLYGALDYLAKQLMPDTAESDELGRWASIWGVERKAADFAAGELDFVGVEPGTVPAGTVLQREDGAQYALQADMHIAGTTGTATVQALVAGEDGNLGPGVGLTLLSPIANVQSGATVGADGLAGGAEQESDDDLRARLLQRIQQKPQGGAVADYIEWAESVPGVTRAFVIAPYAGAGTVGVTFVCDDRPDIIPTSGDVDAVAAYIEPLRPVTADVTVFAPTAHAMALTIHVAPATAAVKAAVTAALQDMLAREAVPGGTILLSHIREAVSAAAGETDNSVTVPAGDFTSTATQIATLGVITWA